MRKRLHLALCLALFPLALEAASLTGVYLALAGKAKSHQYGVGIPSEPLPKYSSGYLGMFVSLYGENFFEITLTLARDNYLMKENSSFRSRYQVGFELGKLISVSVSARGRKLLSPDFSAGIFYRFDLMGAGGGQKMYGDWGFYGVCKVKVNLISHRMRIHSLDLGYKVVVPVHFSYYEGDATVLTQTHSFFIGVSF